MKHLDLFSGYGGFTISAKKLGWETIGFSEIDKYANAVLEYNFSNIKNYGNISDIDFRQFRGKINIITGGTPCQDLSVAGKGRGLEGERSGLFFEFIRAITESEPTYFVWENVKGALWSNKGWDFARVQIEMEQAGYDVYWQVINAKDFGVPQNRERIFAIGIRKGSGREILFEQRESEQNLKSVVSGYSQSDRIYNTDGVSASISAGENGGGKRPGGFYRVNKIVDTGHDGTNIFGTDGLATTQKALGGGQGAKTGLYAISRGRSDDPWKEASVSPSLRVGDKENVRAISTVGSQHPMYAIRPSGDVDKRKYSLKNESGTLSSNPTSNNLPMVTAIPNSNGNVHSLDANYWKGSNNPNKSRRSQIAVPVLTPDRENKQQNGRRFKTDGEPSFTITGQDRHGVFNGMRIRRLTPTECERLMGLEDNWTTKGIIDGEEIDISDTQRYKMCGNGVVVNCVDYIYSLLKTED